MAYHGYIPLIKTFLSRVETPRVLEVGLDRGVTTIPLVVFMSRFHKKYEFVGVDVKLQEQLLITIKNIDVAKDQKVNLHQENSLKLLPELAKKGEKFDVILIDGDHNYYTVKQELQHLEDLAKSTSLVLIDDYHGRWSEKDLWYADREDYASVQDATTKIDTDKHGVKPAVDEYLEKNGTWETKLLIQGEPILLYKKKTTFNQNLFDVLS